MRARTRKIVKLMVKTIRPSQVPHQLLVTKIFRHITCHIVSQPNMEVGLQKIICCIIFGRNMVVLKRPRWGNRLTLLPATANHVKTVDRSISKPARPILKCELLCALHNILLKYRQRQFFTGSATLRMHDTQ